MHSKLIEIVTEDVSRLFRLNSDELFELKLEYGLKYIHDRYPASDYWKQPNDIARALTNSPVFWNWWKELWAQRDRELMKKCELKQYGVNYTFLMNGYIGEQRMQETRRVYWDDCWDFYQDFHYWRKVQFYPNEVMISQCMESQPVAECQMQKQVLSTIKQ